MKQYLDLLKEIKDKGTYKPAARENMPGTQSLFGYQFKHNLQNGFPLLTTKKVFWKGVVIELLWFLRGDTNIKYLVDNGINIWNEDAYNYFKNKNKEAYGMNSQMPLDTFIEWVKKDGDMFNNPDMTRVCGKPYKAGDCGFQYGKVWRDFGGQEVRLSEIILDSPPSQKIHKGYQLGIDQIKNLINGLKNNPESRRHIVTAIDPAQDTNLALYWCHAMFQFNCRPLSLNERKKFVTERDENTFPEGKDHHLDCDSLGIPRYYLDCQLYQRSADVVLGVPFNIASYSLLTHIIAKMCNMIAGEFIHTFGDVHIYDNHTEAVEEQLKREPVKLPNLKLSNSFDWQNYDLNSIWDWGMQLFELENYNPQPSIKAELSTGLKK